MLFLTMFENMYYLQTIIPKWHCYRRWKLLILIYTPSCCLEEGKPWNRSDWNWGNITSDNFINGFAHCDHRQPYDTMKGNAAPLHMIKACRGYGGKSPKIRNHGWRKNLKILLAFSQKRSPVTHSLWLMSPGNRTGNGVFEVNLTTFYRSQVMLV
jgi:hypothetical protein